MKAIDVIISHLDKVRIIGDKKYMALCPVHEEKTPSLSLRETNDGAVLVHCFGCGANGLDLIRALDLKPSDLFPASSKKRDRSVEGFSAKQMLAILQFEAQTMLVGAKMMNNGEVISDKDLSRLKLAEERIYKAYLFSQKITSNLSMIKLYD